MRTSRRLPVLLALTALALPVGALSASGQTSADPTTAVTLNASPPTSTSFATVDIETHATANSASDGDLWPSCWSDDDLLYTANGDGKGFSLGANPSDIAVSRVSGTPGSLTGTTISAGNAVGQVWTPNHNRKPTGMVCVDGAIYLAVQDLAFDFDDAPAATIAKSTDHGQTWTWDRSAPMFGGSVFTTIMFLDFGKNNANAIDGYVYAYGLDHNWRDSFSNRVPDPVDLYLARVPKAQIQNRAAWQFFTGLDSGNQPLWNSDITQRKAVLHDDRRIYQSVYTAGRARDMTVMSQGGVVFNKPLNRYLYTSWTEYTFEFYEAQTPWGPWRLLTTKDFGGYPWAPTKHGGYGTTIPSKFLSADGKSMWLQSNVCPCGGGGASVYTYSLRRMRLEPYVATTPTNPVDDARNLAREPGTVPIERVAHFGNPGVYSDGNRAQNEDDWNDENKPASWWGYTWPRAYAMDKVVYTTGSMFGDGGWFASGLTVQVRKNHVWTNVTGLRVTPGYPHNNTAGPNRTFVLSFDPTDGDGVRVIGQPGGTRTFTSIAELEVYRGGLVTDGGFERQPSGTVSAPWSTEGPGNKGIDRGLGFARSGTNNAFLRWNDESWNALTQPVPVRAGTSYRLTGWVRTSANVTEGYFGVRSGTSQSVHAEVKYGPSAAGYTQLTVDFATGTNTIVTVFGGFWGPGADAWAQFDDIALDPR